MNKKRIGSIKKSKRKIFFRVLIIIIILISGYIIGKGMMPNCPDSCDDNDTCTLDYCSKATDYICKHDQIIPCCGNDICENGENECICQQDCGECSGEVGDCGYYACKNKECAISLKSGCCGNEMCEYKENYKNCLIDCEVKFYGNEIYGKYVTYDCPDKLVTNCEELQKRSNDITYALFSELTGVDLDSSYCFNRTRQSLPIIVHVADRSRLGFSSNFCCASITRNKIKLVEEELEKSKGQGEVISHEMAHIFDFCAKPGINREATASMTSYWVRTNIFPDLASLQKEDWEEDRKGSAFSAVEEFFDGKLPPIKEIGITFQFVDLGFKDKNFVKNYYSLLYTYPDSREDEDIAWFIYLASGRNESVKKFLIEYGFHESNFSI